MKYRAEDTPEEGQKWADQRGGEGYRATDDPNDGHEYARVRRLERLRTVLLSVACSGVVALGIVYVVELGARNNAVDSCNLEMQTRTLLAQQADEAADGVLGDPNEKPPVRPFDFTDTALEEFEPLILAQARANRRRAGQFARSVRDCNELFPRPKFFGIVG